MKNIINNEQMISISDLKKQAKIERKKNPTLKNHAESLKAIAKKNGYDSWEELLDSAYLIFNSNKTQIFDGKKEQIDAKIKNLFSYLSFTKNLINTCANEYEFLNKSNGYNTLYNFFHTNVLKDYPTTSIIHQKIKLLIDFMINAYIGDTKKDKEFKYILNYVSFEINSPLFSMELSNSTMDKLKKYIIHNNLDVYGFDKSRKLEIQNISRIENINDHNEIILILNSIKDKINIMATSYDIVKNNKKDNKYLNNWLSNYENFIKLGNYDEWVVTEVKKYQRAISQNYGGFFNTDKHREALKYLEYYQNEKYGKIIISGTKDEVIEKINTSSSICEDCILDIEKAEKTILNKNCNFVFYYIIH